MYLQRNFSSMRTFISLALFVAIVCIAAAFTDSGWKEMGDVADNALVQDLGKWALLEHNRATGEHLAYTKTVAAGEQSDAQGLYFQLNIQGSVRAGADSYFKAVVEAAGGNTDKRYLLSFVKTIPPQ